MEKAMLIRIVELIEGSEQERTIWIPSLVWLKPLNECLGTIAQSVQPGTLFPKFIGAVENWELQGPLFGGRINPAIFDGQGINDVVEGTSKVLDAVSSDQGPSFNSRWLVNLNEDAIAATVNVTLLADGIRLGISPAIEFGLESIEVFASSLELAPRGCKLASSHTIRLSG